MKSTIRWVVPLVLAALAATLAHAGLFVDRTSGQALERRTYDYVKDYILDHYVEPVDEPEKLFYGAMRGMVKSLDDSHSGFYDPEMAEKLRRDTHGNFTGIGIRFTFGNEGYINVSTPIPGSPAFRAGILPGDKIVKVDGVSVKGWSNDNATAMIMGPEGTHVRLTIRRKELENPFDVEVKRENINLPSIGAVKLLDNAANIGYVRINQFQARTVAEFDNALDELKARAGAKGLGGIVVDLRDNPGGLLEQALGLCNRFVKNGKLLITVSRDEGKTIYSADPSAQTVGETPVVVLINGMSASASEVFTAALYDHGRAVVVGERSFGKGSVQKLVSIPDSDSMVKLTTARYYSPRGCSVQAGVRCLHKGPCPFCGTNGDNSSEVEPPGPAPPATGGIMPHVEIKIPEDAWGKIILQMYDDEVDEERRAAGRNGIERTEPRVQDPHVTEALRILRSPEEYGSIIDKAGKNDHRTGN